MGSLFLNPWLLASLLALAAPIIYHLIRRDEREDRAFPSLMFIKRLKVVDRRRRKLRDKWLLLARLLALACIIAAFARPLWSTSNDSAAGSEQTTQHVFLVDVSASMQMPAQTAQARKVLDQAIGELAAGDSAALIAFDNDARLVHDMSTDHAALRQASTGLFDENDSGATDYAGAFRLANEVLADNQAANGRIAVVSDLQTTGFNDASVFTLEGITIDLLPVQQTAGGNIVISDVMRDENELLIKVVNGGFEATAPTSLLLTINNVTSELKVDGLEAGAGSTVTAPFAFNSGEAITVEVALADSTSAGDDGIPSDSKRAAVFGLGRMVKVAVVTDVEYRRGKSLGERSYLAHAAALTDFTRVVEIEDRRLKAEDFNAVDVIIFDDGVVPDGEVASALASAIDRGVGVLFVSSTDNPDRDGSAGRLTDYLPGVVATAEGAIPTAATDLPSHIGSFVEHHVLTAGLNDALAGGKSLSDVKFLKYQKLTPEETDRVIGVLDNGDPLLIEKTTDKGKVLSLTTSLEPALSNLATAPGFIRLSHSIVDYLADRESVVAHYQRGEVIDLARHAGAFANGGLWRAALTESGAVVESASGRQHRIDPDRAFYRPQSIGIHQARLSSANGKTIAVAVNQNPLESNLDRLTAEAFVQQIQRRPWPQQKGPGQSVEKSADSSTLWRWLLALGALLFLIETVVASRLNRQRISRTEALGNTS